jgi:hypothetical protein
MPPQSDERTLRQPRIAHPGCQFVVMTLLWAQSMWSTLDKWCLGWSGNSMVWYVIDTMVHSCRTNRKPRRIPAARFASSHRSVIRVSVSHRHGAASAGRPAQDDLHIAFVALGVRAQQPTLTQCCPASSRVRPRRQCSILGKDSHDHARAPARRGDPWLPPGDRSDGEGRAREVDR